MPARTRSDLDIHLGLRVKLARCEAGLSQTQLGHELGITFQQVQKYEKGFNRVSAAALFRIAALTGKGIGWFYVGLGREADAIEDAARTQVPHRVIRDLAALQGSPLERSIHNMIGSAAASMVQGVAA